MSMTVISSAKKKKIWYKAVDLFMQGRLNGTELKHLHDKHFSRKINVLTNRHRRAE